MPEVTYTPDPRVQPLIFPPSRGYGCCPGASPDDVEGVALVIWYKADALALNNNDPVETWPDSSGNGHDGTTPFVSPLFATGQLDGLPAVRWPGVSNTHVAVPNVLTALTAGECFCVLKVDADPPPGPGPNIGDIWEFGSNNTDDYYPFTDGQIYMGWGSTVRKTVGNPTPVLTAWRVLNVSSKSAEYIVRLDGTQIFTTATNTVGFDAAPKIGESANGNVMKGYIAEYIMYDGVLVAADRDIVHEYLRTKYPSLTIA